MPEHDGFRGGDAAKQCASARLLAQGNYGAVKECPNGCTHLTFAALSLHFRSVGDFEQFAKKTLAQMVASTDQDLFCLMHRGTTLLLDPPTMRALKCLLKEGVATIQWFRGEMEFSDTDFRNLVDCQA